MIVLSLQICFQPVTLSSGSPEFSPTNMENVTIISNTTHADYPGLEYPPVFEAETYSLADPQSSLTILRKQTKSANP